MELEQFFYISLIMFLCAIVQSSIGFGFGLIALPLMLLLNLPLPEMLVTIAVSSICQRFMAVYKLRKHINWREILPLIVMSTLSLPIGIYLLKMLVSLDKDTVRQYIGVLVAMALVIMNVCKAEPKDRLHPVWAYVAGFFSGILGGLAGIGGPPLVFWIYSHKWHNEKLRILVLAISLPVAIPRLGMMTYTFGSEIFDAAFQGILIIPIVLTGTMLGLKIGKKISPQKLKIFAYSFLGLLCIYMIIKPYIF